MSRKRILAAIFLGAIFAWFAMSNRPQQAVADGGNLPTVGLLEAARTGNAAMVKLHIDVGNKIDLVDDNGMTALDYAAKNDDIKMYQMLFATGKFKEHASNFTFLVAHKLVNADEVIAATASESLLLVKVDGDKVTLRDKPGTIPKGDEKTPARISALARQISKLSSKDQNEVISKVEELWHLPRLRINRELEDQRQDWQSSAEERDVRVLVIVAAEKSPFLKTYLEEFKDNSFMQEVLVVAARITLKMEPKK